MTLAVFAAALFVLANLMGLLAFATLSVSNLGSFQNLGHAHDWLAFSAAIVALLGVSAAAWELLQAKRRADAFEVGAAVVATMLIAIGTLVNAASTSSTQGANIVAAVGVGGWAALVLSRAARRSLTEQQEGATASTRQAGIWLAASVGLFVFAIGSGLVQSPNNQGVSIASAVIEAVGFGVFAGALVVARNEGLLGGPAMIPVLGGLGTLVVAFIVEAIVAGLVYGPSGTITGLRIGVSLGLVFEMLGVAALGYGAWLRTSEMTIAGVPTLWNSAPTTASTPEPSGSDATVVPPGPPPSGPSDATIPSPTVEQESNQPSGPADSTT